MDSTFLTSLVAVADHGGIAGAARRLNLTPSGVTQRIRVLEQQLGVALIARSGRQAVLTPAGGRVVARARVLLRDLHDLAMVAADDRFVGEVRLGAIVTAMTGVIPDILVRIAKDHPLLGLQALPGGSGELYRQVLHGDLDAAIVVRPDFPIAKAFRFELLRREPIVLVTPARLGGKDPLALLRTRPFIRFGRENAGGRLVENYLRSAGIRPDERFELTSLAAIAVAVDRGLGISLVPDWWPPWPGGTALARTALPGSPGSREVGLLWNPRSPRARLVQAVRDAALDAARPDQVAG